MEFTTQFELHSQTTRLFESVSQSTRHLHQVRGSHHYDAVFQQTCMQSSAENTSRDYNSDTESARLQI
ncbi:hypothetical protein T439DRAFT_210843 [Meredithblackwellia eburnea MCA 4105]